MKARAAQSPRRLAAGIQHRVKAIDWSAVSSALDARGSAVIAHLMTAAECRAIADLYAQNEVFRSRVVMARHGYGRGEYKYFDYPLPQLVEQLRSSLYPQLAAVANRWHQAMQIDDVFPGELAEFLERCHEVGQRKPTPLILKYESGDYNCLHQDLYGPHVFPLQLTVLLSDHERDFTGGEFVLTEQRPRMQSRVEVVPLRQGDAVVFAVRQRPVTGARGVYRVNLRHGVSCVRSGRRKTLGIIFHDAA